MTETSVASPKKGGNEMVEMMLVLTILFVHARFVFRVLYRYLFHFFIWFLFVMGTGRTLNVGFPLSHGDGICCQQYGQRVRRRRLYTPSQKSHGFINLGGPWVAEMLSRKDRREFRADLPSWAHAFLSIHGMLPMSLSASCSNSHSWTTRIDNYHRKLLPPFPLWPVKRSFSAWYSAKPADFWWLSTLSIPLYLSSLVTMLDDPREFAVLPSDVDNKDPQPVAISAFVNAFLSPRRVSWRCYFHLQLPSPHKRRGTTDRRSVSWRLTTWDATTAHVFTTIRFFSSLLDTCRDHCHTLQQW